LFREDAILHKQTDMPTKSAKDKLKVSLKRTPRSLGKKFERLNAIVELLRTDCPWDKKQTAASLKPLMLEEVYETAEAIDAGDDAELRKELGDVTMHIIFHAIIAREQKKFTLETVLDGVAEKLIFRHPHIFANVKVKNDTEVKSNWEKLKLTERGGGKSERKTVLGGVPVAMPQLVRAYRMQEKASGVGFDWPKNSQGQKAVFEKVREEISELEAAAKSKRKADIEDEFGDLLFSLVNASRFIGVSPEDALRKANAKFKRRFEHIEATLHNQKKLWSDVTLGELDEIWNVAKQKEKKKEP
jgi:XTP/dITP diphosphohydrolase